MTDARNAQPRDVYSKLRALRGKVRFDLDLKQLREDRLLDLDLPRLR